MGSVARMTAPYRAVLKKDWEALKRYYKDNSEAVSFPLTVTNDTVFHIAVHSRNEKLLEELLSVAPPIASRLTNSHGNTALHEAASTGQVRIAELLLDLDEKQQAEAPSDVPKLVEIKNSIGESALFRAAAFGQTEMVKYLFSKVNMETHCRRSDNTSIMHVAVAGKHFDTALALVNNDKSLATLIDENRMTCLQLLANMPSAFKSGFPMQPSMRILYWCLPDHYSEDKDDTDKMTSQREDLESGHGMIHSGCSHSLSICKEISRLYYAIWRCLAVLPTVNKLWKAKAEHQKVLKLTKILAEKDLTWRRENADPGFETPIIAAARHGIIEIVQAILKVYPQAIEHVNKRDENIFHIAARHRKTEILDLLLYSPHIPMLRLIRKINIDGDSILHQAAYWRETQLRDRPGEALRMQSDIQWFERVKKIVPRHFINYRNRNKKTAQELFSIEHKKLVEEGGEWLRRTTQACTLVAVLIATVAFTCAYTVPGGSNQRTGSPVFVQKLPFRVFAVSDAISLCFALTSVVVFLSILTSTMHEKDFRISLPLKLVLGLTTLFLSVASLMASFSATLILIIRQRLHWAAIPIYAVAAFPVSIFLLLQFPLYLNMAWFTVRDILCGFIDCLPHPKFMTTKSAPSRHD